MVSSASVSTHKVKTNKTLHVLIRILLNMNQKHVVPMKGAPSLHPLLKHTHIVYLGLNALFSLPANLTMDTWCMVITKEKGIIQLEPFING